MQRADFSLTHQANLFQKYISCLLHELTPEDDSPDHANRKISLGKVSPSSSIHSTSSMKDYFSYLPPPAPHPSRRLGKGTMDHPLESTSSTSSMVSISVAQPVERDSSSPANESMDELEEEDESVEETEL